MSSYFFGSPLGLARNLAWGNLRTPDCLFLSHGGRRVCVCNPFQGSWESFSSVKVSHKSMLICGFCSVCALVRLSLTWHKRKHGEPLAWGVCEGLRFTADEEACQPGPSWAYFRVSFYGCGSGSGCQSHVCVHVHHPAPGSQRGQRHRPQLFWS